MIRLSTIFVLRFKNEAYSVNILNLSYAANVSNDSTKVAVYLPTLPTFPTIPTIV